MSDVTQGNSAEARTETGEIKDQQTTQPAGSANTEPTKTLIETKPASTEPAKPAEAKAATGAPEKYDFKAPEGYELDPKVIAEATPLLKELNLTNDQAQKLVDIWNKHSIESVDAAYKQYEETRTKWRDEVVKDSALGNGTDNLKPEVRANVSKAIEAIGDPKAITAFKEAMDLTGSGDNPAFVRALNAWGKLLSEGTLVRGTAPSALGQKDPAKGPTSAAAAMYPNLRSSTQA